MNVQNPNGKLQRMAHGIRNEIRNLAGTEAFDSILGPTCETQGFCREGNESCGKIYVLQKSQSDKK